MGTTNENFVNDFMGIGGQREVHVPTEKDLEGQYTAGDVFVEGIRDKMQDVDSVPTVHSGYVLPLEILEGEDLNTMINNETAVKGIYLVRNLDYSGTYESPGDIDDSNLSLVYYDGTGLILIDQFDDSSEYVSPGGTYND